MASRTGGKQLVLLLWLIVLLFAAGIPAAVAQQSQELPPLELQVQVSEGDAEVKADGDLAWKKLEQGDTLAEGDRVRTGDDGKLQLEAPGMALTELEPEASIQVKRLDRDGDTPGKTINHIRIRALKGKIINSIRDHEGVETQYRLSSENGVAGLRGTNFLYEIGPEGSVATSVLDGEVFFYHPDRPDRGAAVTAGQRRRLPVGSVQPTDTEELEENARQRLEQFRGEAARKLRLNPRLESLRLGDTPVEKAVRIRYEQPRTLTLTGVARALEPGANLRQLTVEGEFVESTLRFDTLRSEQSWKVSAEPAEVEEGSRRRLRIRLRATDSLGTVSEPRIIELILVNPEHGQADNKADTEAVLERLESMRRALTRKDVEGYMEAIGSGAEIRLRRGILNRTQFGEALSEVVPLLQDFSWEYEVRRVRRVASDTDLVRVNLESRYSADLMEPVGVSLGVTSGGVNPLDGRTKRLRTLRSRALEQYVFHPGEGGQPTVTAMSNGLFLSPDLRREARRIRGRWSVKSVLFALFYYYENGRSGSFESLVHPQFLNLDDNEFRHDREDFLDSVRADLAHLNNLDHRVRVDSLQFVGPDEVEVEITWSRRARLGNTNQLWLLQRQRSVLRFRSGSSFTLYRIQGDPLFGLSSARTRTTLVRGGTIDGEENNSTEMIGDDLELTSADPTEFPELDPEEAEELEEEASGNNCVSGNISEDVTTDQTWCGEIQLQNSIAIQPGATLTVQDNTTVNIPAGESLEISGTLEATNVTFPGPGQSNQGGGLILKDGADVTIRNSSFSPSNNANAAITIEDGAEVTLVSEGNEYDASATGQRAQYGVDSGAAQGSLSFTNDTFREFRSCGIQQDTTCLDNTDGSQIVSPDVTIDAATQFIGIGGP